jgi:DNA polymerase
MLYDDVPDVLSQLVRTALIAPKGKIFSVADFSAIEARVISWLANEEWRMEVFRGEGKIYEATGARMFGVPISSITKGSALRDKSKISELALGFGGSVGALAMMGGERMGLSAAEMASLVKKWRMANPNIVQMWSDFESCAINSIKHRRTIISDYRGVMFSYDGFYLIVTLPSGRQLFYMKPRIGTSRIGTTCIYYRGTIQATKQWGEVDTYGGKLTENIVQATARDLMGHAMLLLDSEGYDIVMHVHDEVIAEVPIEQGAEKLKRMERLMSIQPTWAMDLPLNADGYLTTFYKKD